MRRILVISVVTTVFLAGAVLSVLALAPPASRAAAPSGAKASALSARAETVPSVGCCRCPKSQPLPLPADAVDRAADQARIQAPALYPGRGPAVVELAWRAVFRLQVWASAPLQCGNLVRGRTVVVDLLFPKMLPSASLSEGVILVSLFRPATGPGKSVISACPAPACVSPRQRSAPSRVPVPLSGLARIPGAGVAALPGPR